MKISARDIESFVKSPPAQAMAVLLYGPDEGLARERLMMLTKTVVADVNDPFNVAELSGEDLLAQPSRLLDEAQALSMMGGRRVVRVRDATDKSTPAVKAALAALRPGDALVLVQSDSLGPRSALRLLFEQDKTAAALPCYVDDERDMGRVISQGLRDAGYSISPDALSSMASHIVGDRGVARGEVEKLIIYMGAANKNISLDDVTACVSGAASVPLDDLARFTASGQFAEADRVLSLALSEGAAPVMILRTLQNYFTRLHITKARVAEGETLEGAMMKLRPAIFFKNKAAFEAQVRSLGLLQVEQALSVIISAEARCKQTGVDAEIMTGRAVLSLCQIAGRAARRASSR